MKHKFKIRVDAVRGVNGARLLAFQRKLEEGEKYVCPIVIIRTTRNNVDLKMND